MVSTSISIGAPAAAHQARPQGYLFGPWADFILLGGSTFFILPVLLFIPTGYDGFLATALFLLSSVINHPHFVHSYQLFYRNFRRKLAGDGYGRNLQIRYFVAGVAVPLILAGFFLYAIANSDPMLLGYAGNLLFFFVGWHYVKQGYGMLMVDAVLKRRFFTGGDKKVLLANTYAVWLCSWLKGNAVIAGKELWGLQYYTFAVPGWLVSLAAALAILTTLALVATLFKRWRANGGTLPWNGVMAYSVTLYTWILFVSIHPLWMMVVPALHSLQYLAIVWRFQTNIELDRVGANDDPELLVLRPLRPMYRLHVAMFLFGGVALGLVGFYALPVILKALVPYNEEVLGAALFIFVVWIFINVHHYFLDNVMWRRENPEVSKYLFR